LLMNSFLFGHLANKIILFLGVVFFFIFFRHQESLSSYPMSFCSVFILMDMRLTH
jgi:hypothetical protein